jgi:hypothetical protein
VVSGRAVAAWSLRKSGDRGGRVLVEAFAPLGGSIRAGIEAEVAQVGRFLELRLELEIAR